jgi:hypothetical protein
MRTLAFTRGAGVPTDADQTVARDELRACRLTIGSEPLELPEPLGRLVARLADQADTRTGGDGGPRWLFQGARRAAPLGEGQFSRWLRRLGIPTLAGRTGALLGLAATIPPAILADLLGVSEGGAANWSQLAGGDWARYAAHGADR